MAEDLETQLVLTRLQIEQRREMGDQLAAPRLTDHTAEFRKRKAAEAAAQELRGLGYEVNLGKRGMLKTLLEADKQASVDRSTAESFVREVFGVVSKHWGDYDGWGGPVED